MTLRKGGCLASSFRPHGALVQFLQDQKTLRCLQQASTLKCTYRRSNIHANARQSQKRSDSKRQKAIRTDEPLCLVEMLQWCVT